jgi:hypothetical protein
MITSTVRLGTSDHDARFPWVLDVRGVPSECGELRWEQFVSGGFRVRFSDGSSRYYSPVATMQRINPRARQFGPWTDDLLPNMTPGPRSVGAYHGASCGGGVLAPLANPGATMRGPSVSLRGATYRFEDAPGFSWSFDDVIEGRAFVGISWDVRFSHKLWRQGDTQPLHRQLFSLTGLYDRSGSDTRRIV